MYSTTLITLIVTTVLTLQSCKGQDGEAYAHINSGLPMIKGIVSFVKIKEGVKIFGIIKGLTKGLHGLHIHENGNTTDECKNVGGIYNPYNKRHGCSLSSDNYLGDLGNIKVDVFGLATFNLHHKYLELIPSTGKNSGIVGLSIGVDKYQDNCVAANSGPTIGCGIIILLN